MTVAPLGTTGAVFADLDRPDPLEARFGDPLDPDNSLNFGAFLQADERGDLLFAGERMLDSYGLGAEFVPRAYGGRFGQMDRLARVLRPLFARDVALGIGHGVSNLVSSVNVWSSGSEQQRRWLADVLLRGGKVSAGYTELAHGNDLGRAGLQARHHGGELRLDGRKEVINNLARADAVTLFVRTSQEPGSRSHSMVLVDLDSVPRDRVRYLPRYRTVGVRGMYLGGMEFTDCPVPLDSVTGGEGEAMESVLRAFQVTRGVLPGAAIGLLDTQLRTVLRFATERRLYGRSVAELPHARAVLTGAFLDVLVCDSLSTVVCRALHVLPEQTSVLTAAVKYLVPTVIQESVDQLAVLLGARSFLREGPYGIFQKHLRDLPMATLVHAGGTVCQATIIPQLPRLARRSWLTAGPPPSSLFRLGEPLPDLEFGRLAISGKGEDGLAAALLDVAEYVKDDPELRSLTAVFIDELRRLRDSAVELAPRDRTPLAAPESFTLARRYSVVLAAAACLGVWRHNQDHPDPFVRDAVWVSAALRRLAVRLGLATDPAPAGAERLIATELMARLEEQRGFDLIGRRLAG